jgi:dipeptidyl aminopeptidase/acylaminoacyl peptidase
VVVRAGEGNAPADMTGGEENVRSLVHEYGGGEYRVHEGSLVYTDMATGRVLIRDTQGRLPVEVLHAGPARHADFAWSADAAWIAAVQERAGGEGREPENRIVAFRPELPDGDPVVAADGHDFVSSPCFAPDGRSIAYLAWNHPNMPWDGTRLFVRGWGADGPEGEARCVAGGDRESIFQPRFSPEGRLAFVSDRSGWWNLYSLEPGRVESGAAAGAADLQPLCARDAEFGRPQWVFGMSTWDWVSEDEILCSVSERGFDRLCRLDLTTGNLRDLGLPHSSVVGVEVEGGQACFVGGCPDRATEITRVDLFADEGTDAATAVRASFEIDVPVEAFSSPEAIEFPTADGLTAHAFYYAPTNPACSGPPGELPPLLVKSHGGPTSSTVPVLNLALQYWTSRGFAVVDVNYGGSSGYGRAYRDRLQAAWGIVDVADCVNAARYLAETGRADPERMAISGGSAGGYTTLCALTFHDTFAAGASHYGIGDLEALARDTHKFESRYLDGLVGPYPQRADLYRERSPIHSADRLTCPVAFFQGLEDKVVPPNQAEAMVAALAARGIPHAHVTFEGEQHGFRKAENIQCALEGELYFYARIFGFDADVSPEGIEIVGVGAVR